MKHKYFAIHIYISIKYDPLNSDYQLEHSTTGELDLLGDNASITNKEVPVLLFLSGFVGGLAMIQQA